MLVGQFAGAAGTLASLGDKGFEVQQALCEELGLGVPVSTWHVARDGLAETVQFPRPSSPARSARSRSTS